MLLDINALKSRQTHTHIPTLQTIASNVKESDMPAHLGFKNNV